MNIDAPLVVVGRTSKSWGTNMVLMNPGKGKVDNFLSDAHTERRYTPLTNFTFNNLAIEGLLTAAAAFPVRSSRRTRWISAVTSGRLEPSSSDARRRTSTSPSSSPSSTRTSPRIPSSRLSRARERHGFRWLADRVVGAAPPHRVIPQSKYSGDVHEFADALGAADFLAMRLA